MIKFNHKVTQRKNFVNLMKILVQNEIFQKKIVPLHIIRIEILKFNYERIRAR
jgi:hypothetical protein